MASELSVVITEGKCQGGSRGKLYVQKQMLNTGQASKVAKEPRLVVMTIACKHENDDNGN